MDIFSVILLLGGLTFFMFGMQTLSSSLEKMSGGKLEQMLRRVTSNPISSIALGAIITIAVQSSSATTVMLVGLVNSGMMQFSETIYVIFGANIGTTLTSWILSLSGIESQNTIVMLLKPEYFSLVFAFIGIILIMFVKRDSYKNIGNSLVGFAILMYGMEFMKEAVTPLSQSPEFANLLLMFSNPILGVLVGLVFTAIIQSSAASIGILQALALTGSVTYGMAIPIIMGLNIGTCATSLISSIGTSKNAKRVAAVHISIKVIATVICLSAYCLLDMIFDFPLNDMPVNAVTIALVHTVFNILSTALLLPFKKQIIKLGFFLVKADPAEESEKLLIDERLLFSPSVAVAECFNVTKRMANMARDAIITSLDNLFVYESKVNKNILKYEDSLDEYEDKIGTFLVKVTKNSLSNANSRQTSRILHSIGDFERLGDHAKNLLEVSEEINEKQLTFSSAAMAEINNLCAALREIVSMSIQAFTEADIELAKKVEPLEQVIDALISEARLNHIDRLQKGFCTIANGFTFSDMLTNFERISDHCSNIAVCLIETENNSFDTHTYILNLKKGKENEQFEIEYEKYSQKFMPKYE